jgi:hypothetical protein
MILPEGITGFFEGGRDATPPVVDPSSFVGACYAAARAESGRVERFEPAGVSRNYHRAILRMIHGPIAVLCNAHFPIIAFAEASDDLPLRFVEAEALASRIEEVMPCEIASRPSLEAHPDAESLANLRAAERDQIRYWRPPRLGEIIFNFWD